MANLQDKRGTAAALAAANPTPLEGEVLYETDTRKFKVGDGSAAYTSLSYVGLSSIATANGVSAAVALGVATISLGAITPSSVTVSGGFDFTGTGNRITGDFSNATIANRVAFQSSTINGNTDIQVLPNGTSFISGIRCNNNSDLTNAGYIRLSSSTTIGTVDVNRNSVSGTYLPLGFNTGGAERVRIDTAGFVGVGTASPTSLLHIQQPQLGVGTVSNSAGGTTVTGVSTKFLDTFKVGDMITVPGTGSPTQTVVISAIASNTSMTVAAITSANSAVSYSLAGGTRFSVAGNGTITTSSSGDTLSGTNTGDQTAASLGLVIGTNVQAYDAGLLSIAAATTAADRFLYTTALDVYAVATITTFGRSLVDDADAATARTTLGLGTISTQASSAVAITGGTINGSTIGATTAATGAFTVVTHSAGTALLPSITPTGDTNTGIWFPTADTVGVSTGGVDRVRIDSSGNIGLGARLAGGATNSYHLGTQAGLGLSIYHAAKGGQIDAYQLKRHLLSYTYSSTVTQYGIMRIRIPAIAGGGHRLTIKHTGFTSPIYSRSWEINCADYYSANYIFGANSISVEGAPDFSRVRLMENTSETIWNSLATRYLILGQIIDGIGTVSNTAVSATVTGSGTKFTHLFKVGDGIFINSLWNYITAIASDTSLTVAVTITLANTAVVYSRGDVFVGSQMTIDLDQLHAGGTLQINTAFGIDCADTEATLSLVAGVGRDITLNNTNAQHGFVGIGTQSPSNLLHVAQQKLGRGTISNSAAGTTVTGVNTTFLDTFKVGDSITVPHIGGSTGTPQALMISAIASNTSLTVSTAITSANSAVSYSLVGGTLFSVAGNGTITTSSGNTLSGTNTGDQTAASLGLVIGTNVQAYDAGLLSIAAATTAADSFLYTTALDVYAVGTITTFGRSLVDDADAATARTTLGLGTISTQASSAVAITGGTINGATIGATTAATGAFTVVTHSAGTALLPSITTSGDTDTGVWFPAADTVGVSTGGVEQVRVDSAGNVGLGVRVGYSATPTITALSTQANAGLTIYHAAKGGAVDLNQPKRHLSAYVYTSAVGGGFGIMRIRIPNTGTVAWRYNIKHTGVTSPANSRSWEITFADSVSGSLIFGDTSISVSGAPEFSRVRLMQNTSETIWNSYSTRYLILGEIVNGVGTVSVTAFSQSVVGVGTKFTNLFKANDGMLINGTWCVVQSITNDLSLTLVNGPTAASSGAAYSRGDYFVSPQMTIDVDQLNADTPANLKTNFGIDFADTEATLSLVTATKDIRLSNTNAQHGFVGVGTQSPTNLFQISQRKFGKGTVTNGAGGTTVTGANGTTFLDTFKVGDTITIPPMGGSTGTPQSVVISAIASNTSMTVAAITNANSGAQYGVTVADPLIVNGNGNVTTGLGVLTVSGGRIAFPATANLSAGANTLDDYEEGTWTPTFTATTTNPTVTYDAAVRYGVYVKIGKTVFISGTVVITALTAAGSGNLQISGLPFTASSGTTGGYGSLALGYKASWTTTTPGTAYVQASTAYVALANEAMTATITTANLSAASYVMFSGFYNTTS